MILILVQLFMRITRSDNTLSTTQTLDQLLTSTSKKTINIAVLSSYPPRECGIATYTDDLITALQAKHQADVNYHMIAIDSNKERYAEIAMVKQVLDPGSDQSYQDCICYVNTGDIDLCIIQHEFGLFYKNEPGFFQFLEQVSVPVLTVFHTVLPRPDDMMYQKVRSINQYVEQIIVMTEKSEEILIQDYQLEKEKISVIPHGTHKVVPKNTDALKKKYNAEGRKVVSTFGLLGPGKSIETTLHALPSIIEKHKDVLFLVLGKTHPSLVAEEGEKYRDYLEGIVEELQITEHVRFVNKFLEINELLDYLQLTDIYLFTSKDPNQAVSGTFSYAVSCGCPIISTPIPHATEVLRDDVGQLFDFGDSKGLSELVLEYFDNPTHLHTMSLNALHISSFNTWENSAINHVLLFNHFLKDKELSFSIPETNINHILKLTTDFGMLQFSKFSSPDIDSGYTLDDNARALIFALEYYEETRDIQILHALKLYLEVMLFCYQPETKSFLNYVDYTEQFTDQNNEDSLEDSNGRAIWALGSFIKHHESLPDIFQPYVSKVLLIIQSFISHSEAVSPRSIAFTIKGLLHSIAINNKELQLLIKNKVTYYADILIGQYRANSEKDWDWFEPSITYGNAILPEALLLAGDYLNNNAMIEVAEKAIRFLVKHTSKNGYMELISNRSWFDKGNIEHREEGGEQPIDASYTTMALAKFNDICPDKGYDKSCRKSFEWFLGKNRLNQAVYDQNTGGCYDGLETKYVNLNQGAESTVCYHLASNAVRSMDKKSKATTPIAQNLINLKTKQSGVAV
ncbi:glycosyltransferase [Aquimarina sp. ERC-38]|uniref:glycosyltransferase n=1 Tax=Aquimarina sp. ERC-38 TaxID=2949996 RepID=UPI0022450F6F|nr:glycosyltransferase [Aquimarina sp. ERC-38]UZO81131.1 glycosyltransferase [Aquimarina sp. ERC-38]